MSVGTVEVVDFTGWERLDAAERAAGQRAGKVREKVVAMEDMLSVTQKL
jgi:hypothetical protein